MILLFSAAASATTLLALIDRKHHRVVIAGDSLLNFRIAGTSTQTCKIVVKPGCTFGMAGLFDKEYPVFHLQELGEEACSVPQDLRHKADAFLDIAKDPSIAVAQYLRDNEPQFFAELTNSNAGELVMVIFAGTQDGKSAIFARGYKLDPSGGIVPVSADVLETNSGIGFFAGANQAIAAYVKSHPKWQKMDRIAAAKKFVQLEIQAHPSWVGPPVSVVTINHLDQEKWVDRGVCAPVAPIENAPPPAQP
jgi:hypothetical protein